MDDALLTMERELAHLRQVVERVIHQLDRITQTNQSLQTEVARLQSEAEKDKGTIASLQKRLQQFKDDQVRGEAAFSRETEIRSGLRKIVAQLDQLETSF